MAKRTAPDHRTILKRKAPGRPVGATGAATRERILQTSASMFALHGLQNVSLAEIAGACGMTAPAIYNHFSSKDVIFIEVVRTMYDEILLAFVAALDTDLGLNASLDRVLDTCLEIYREDQVLARLGQEATLLAARSPGHYPEFQELKGKLQALFTGAVARGVKSGELSIDTDVEETGAVLHHLILGGISGRSLAAPSEAQFRRTIEAFRHLMTRRPAELARKDGQVVLSVVPQSSEQKGNAY